VKEIKMSDIDIARAWKDEAYRQSLSEAELAELPENPVGLIELEDEDLDHVDGGSGWACVITVITAVSVAYCSPNGTFCGSCEWGTHACCEEHQV
jgi:mersacidin/lichenicidin family type 2 lantibiotic